MVMSIFQGIMLVLVAVGGAAVVLTYDPRKQAIVAGIFGMMLAILFFAFQSADVALSQIAVSSVPVPAMVLLTMAAIRRRSKQ